MSGSTRDRNHLLGAVVLPQNIAGGQGVLGLIGQIFRYARQIGLTVAMGHHLKLAAAVGVALHKLTFAVAVEIGRRGRQRRNVIGRDAHIGKRNRA
ncbi:MAG: hypothetical protein R2911_01315 [Caldilineaceae bacterium]